MRLVVHEMELLHVARPLEYKLDMVPICCITEERGAGEGHPTDMRGANVCDGTRIANK